MRDGMGIKKTGRGRDISRSVTQGIYQTKQMKRKSHKIVISKVVTNIIVSIKVRATSSNKASLGLSSLGLLSTLISGLFFLELLVTGSRHGTGNLLDFLAGEILD